MHSLDSNNQFPTFIPLNVSSMFEPLKIEAYLNADEEDCVLCDSFLNLINEQMKLNKPYMLALVQDVGSSFTFCFDAMELDKWTENNWTNPQNRNVISQIFYFSISGYSSSTYLGRCMGWDKAMISCIENKSLLSTNKQFIKIDGIENVMNLKPFLKACVFVDTKEIVNRVSSSDKKNSFFELLKSQEKSNLPYVFAVVQDVDSLNLSYFDGSEFKGWCKENSTNPITCKKIANAFYCMIPPNLTKNQNVNFKYLGDFKEEGDKKIFVDAYFLALKGNPVLQYFVGVDYKLGKNVIQDFEQAVMWYKLAVENDYPDALFDLGVCYNDGLGIKKDMKKAVAMWKRAAAYDHAEAYYHLGLNYFEGKGIQKDTAIAALYFKSAGVLKHLEAKNRFEQWKLTAPDKELGQCYCLMGLICMYFENEGLETAINYLSFAVKKGNADAHYLLLRLYYFNDLKAKGLELLQLGVDPNFEEIHKYWKFAGSKSFPHEHINFDNVLAHFQHDFAIIIFEYRSEYQGADKTIKWLKLAAVKGHVQAQYLLGFCYYYGECIKENHKEGLKWLKLAAKQDNAEAKLLLTQIQTRK